MAAIFSAPGPTVYTYQVEMPYVITPPEVRFWKYVLQGADDDCWPWQGGRSMGYGRFMTNASTGPVAAHRFAYETLISPISDGLHIHHRCENKLCVNPAHMELVSVREHPSRHTRTVCRRGHVYAETGVYISKKTGYRRCAECRRQTNRAAWPKSKRRKQRSISS